MPDHELDDSSLQACVTLMQGGSKTFFAASRLLPLRIRNASIALYAFCRVADDLVDEASSGESPLAQLKERLDLIYAGTPSQFVEDQALSVVVQKYQLPRHLLDALIEGFAWDAAGRTYQTLADLHDYAARVAGSVGAMMCWIMGPQCMDTLARACELGVAMQLTNIARDVGADAAMRRIYLPREWLHEAGIEPEDWIRRPVCTPALQSVIARLLDEADRLYKQSQCGIAALPPDCRAAILSASLIYWEIGQQLRQKGLNSVQYRTVVSTPRKLLLLATAWAQAPWIRTATVTPKPLPAINYLVRSCQQAHVRAQQPSAYFPNRTMPQRVNWVIDLLERLENERSQKRQDVSHSQPV